MRQLSLVAFYGHKDTNLLSLISECQETVAAIPGIRFQPYDMLQVHATIVSLGRVAASKFNLNLANLRNRQASMDFEALLDFLRHGGRFPFQIQVGGFQNRTYPFVSGDQTPYHRSFQVINDKVVLMGWPIRGKPLTITSRGPSDLVLESRVYPNTLDDMRRAFQTFNILHTYHRAITDVDNDFYFRIGILDPTSLTSSSKENLESTFRGYLASITPVILELTISDVYVASYCENTLSPDSTRVWSVSDTGITAHLMWELYD